jgi:hypothetical protein
MDGHWRTLDAAVSQRCSFTHHKTMKQSLHVYFYYSCVSRWRQIRSKVSSLMRVLEYKMCVAFILVFDKLSTVSIDMHATLTSQLSWNLGSSISWNPQGLYRDCFALSVYLFAGLFVTSFTSLHSSLSTYFSVFLNHFNLPKPTSFHFFFFFSS